jgi:hypothetical protein
MNRAVNARPSPLVAPVNKIVLGEASAMPAIHRPED